MTPTVTVVDYDCGNLFSVSHAIEHCGGRVEFAAEPGQIASADRLILPGVGAFGAAMNALRERRLIEAIHTFVATGRPFLGICVGMQAMMEYSEEFGRHEGLGLMPGHVAAIPDTAADGSPHLVPHIGWSDIEATENGWRETPLRDVHDTEAFYFVHSYTARPGRPDHLLATCDYNGRTISAAIAHENMTGCQFHPEKSGPAGLKILTNFLSL